MYPDLIAVGSLKITSYGLSFAASLIVCLVITIRMGQFVGFTKTQVLDMGLVILSCGLITGRLAHVLLNWTEYLDVPYRILCIWDGGLIFPGGLVGGFLGSLWYAKRQKISLWQLGDTWVPGISAAQIVEKFGSLLEGSYYGSPLSAPWAVVFTDSNSSAPLNIPLHPTQLYSMIAFTIIFTVLAILTKRKSYHGQVFLWYLVLYSNAQLLVDRFRGDLVPIFPESRMTASQLMATIILMVGAVTLVIQSLRTRRAKNNKASTPQGQN